MKEFGTLNYGYGKRHYYGNGKDFIHGNGSKAGIDDEGFDYKYGNGWEFIYGNGDKIGFRYGYCDGFYPDAMIIIE